MVQPNLKTKTIVAGVVTVIMVYVMNLTGKDLATSITPNKIVDLELAKNKVAVEKILAAWSKTTANGKTIIDKAKINTYFDFLFLASYGALFYYWNRFLAEKQAGSYKRWLEGVALAAVVAAIFDIVENVLMLQSLNYQANDLVAGTTTLCAQLKFILIGVAMVSAVGFSMVNFAKNKNLYAL